MLTSADLVDNPQLIFESLNSTGIDLTQSDLIRNYLLMGLPEEDQTRLYNDYWSRMEATFRHAGGGLDYFLRDYIALKQELTTQPLAEKSMPTSSPSGPNRKLLQLPNAWRKWSNLDSITPRSSGRR